jgi:hypothetical protein
VPLERINEVVTCKPSHRRRYGQRVEGQDTQPLRHQAVDLPPLTPQGMEYQVHRLHCPRCRITTCGQLPAGLPAQDYGPRFTSLSALCSWVSQTSKRKLASFCRDVLGVALAVGEVCEEHQTTSSIPHAGNQARHTLGFQARRTCALVPRRPGDSQSSSGWRCRS